MQFGLRFNLSYFRQRKVARRNWVAALFSVAFIKTVSAVPVYTLTVLSAPLGSNTAGITALYGLDGVLGWGYSGSTTPSAKAFLPGSGLNLTGLGVGISVPRAASPFGVVGESVGTTGNTNATLFGFNVPGSAARNLTASAIESYATDINSAGAGTVVGHIRQSAGGGPNSFQAFAHDLSNDSTTSLGSGFTFGINNNGLIVGESTFSSQSRAATFQIGSSTPFDLGAGNQSTARGVSDLGHIVGWNRPGNDGNDRAFLINPDGSMSNLGTLGGASSQAWDVNTSGVVIGTSFLSSGGMHGFLYQDNQMYDLTALIDPSMGWSIFDAKDIDEFGDIAALGVHNTLGLRALRLHATSQEYAGASQWGSTGGTGSGGSGGTGGTGGSGGGNNGVPEPSTLALLALTLLILGLGNGFRRLSDARTLRKSLNFG